MPTPKEPKRNADIDSLEPYVADRVRRVLAAMQAAGYDAVVFEARRSQERQEWLFSIGRVHQTRRKPVTYIDGVRVKSKHQTGKAVDIISKSKLWNAPPAFWRALKQEGAKVGLRTLSFEQCHLEWRG